MQLASLEPDLSWLSAPIYVAAKPSPELEGLLTGPLSEILSSTQDPNLKQIDPFTLLVLTTMIGCLIGKVVDECWERCFKRAKYNPFYRRRCVAAFADQLENRDVAHAHAVAGAAFDHFRHMDPVARIQLFGAVRAAQ